MIPPARLRHRLLPGLLLTSLASGACDEGTISGPEVEVMTMRLIAGVHGADVSSDGTVTGPILIPLGTTDLHFEFLDRTGNPDPDLTAALYEARVVASPAAVLTAHRIAAFGFDLTGVAEGDANLSAGLYHRTAGHWEFGPFDVPVTVAAGP